MPHPEPRRVALAGSLLLALALCSACGSTSTSGAGGSTNAVVVRITATPSGCPPVPARVPAGVVEVIASNLDAPTVSEVEVRSGNLSQVLGEKENLIQGMSAKFSISVSTGTYVVNCPGAAESHWALTAIRAETKSSS
jgi:iron uptake system component EfeO